MQKITPSCWRITLFILCQPGSPSGHSGVLRRRQPGGSWPDQHGRPQQRATGVRLQPRRTLSRHRRPHGNVTAACSKAKVTVRVTDHGTGHGVVTLYCDDGWTFTWHGVDLSEATAQNKSCGTVKYHNIATGHITRGHMI